MITPIIYKKCKKAALIPLKPHLISAVTNAFNALPATQTNAPFAHPNLTILDRSAYSITAFTVTLSTAIYNLEISTQCRSK